MLVFSISEWVFWIYYILLGIAIIILYQVKKIHFSDFSIKIFSYFSGGLFLLILIGVSRQQMLLLEIKEAFQSKSYKQIEGKVQNLITRGCKLPLKTKTKKIKIYFPKGKIVIVK